MLTFALCVIAFFIGIVFTIWFFFGFLNSIFSKVSDGFGMMYDTWCAESNKPKPEPEVINIDLRSLADKMVFVINFAIEKCEEFEVRFLKRQMEIKRDKEDVEAALKEEEENGVGDISTASEMWKEYGEHLKNRSEMLKNTEGIPKEYLRNTEGIPEEYPKEYPDNQGIPVNEELIDDSQKSSSDIWKSTL